MGRRCSPILLFPFWSVLMVESDLVDIPDLKARADTASAFLKILAHPDRLMVVCVLVSGERSVRELEGLLDIRQPGLSQRLGELRKAGVIASRKEGRSVYCRLADQRAEQFVATLHHLFCDQVVS